VIGWLYQHRQALGGALTRFARTAGLLSALVIGVALALPAGGYALLEGLRGLGARLSFEPQLSVFLRPEAKRAEAEALGGVLRADRRIAAPFGDSTQTTYGSSLSANRAAANRFKSKF